MSERCPRCHQFHSGACSVPQGVCFHCGQSGHLKKSCPKLTAFHLGDSFRDNLGRQFKGMAEQLGGLQLQLGPQ